MNRIRLDQELLDSIKSNLQKLEELLTEVNGHWSYEDYVYRLIHHSFKVYYAQDSTEKMVNLFKSLLPGIELNKDFMQIVSEGTGKKFDLTHNKNWLASVRPIVEAFLHAKYMLEMMIKYGKEFEIAPHSLPSGWASVLYLYNTR